MSMNYGYCTPSDDTSTWPTGLAFGFTYEAPNFDNVVPDYRLVPAKRGDEIVAYALQNDDDRRDGVFFTFYPGLFHRDIVDVRDFAKKNACDRDVIELTYERNAT